MVEEVLCHNCGDPAKYRGLRECARCYQRFRAHGDYDLHTREKSVCLAGDCPREVKFFGWCAMHWSRLAKYDDPDGGKWSRREQLVCVVPGCGQRPRAMNLCGKHYSREGKNGHPIWKTHARRKVHGDRPWNPESVLDLHPVIGSYEE